MSTHSGRNGSFISFRKPTPEEAEEYRRRGEPIPFFIMVIDLDRLIGDEGEEWKRRAAEYATEQQAQERPAAKRPTPKPLRFLRAIPHRPQRPQVMPGRRARRITYRLICEKGDRYIQTRSGREWDMKYVG